MGSKWGQLPFSSVVIAHLLASVTLSMSASASGSVAAITTDATTTLTADGGTCQVQLTRNRENGALELYVDGKKLAPDVTSLIPLSDRVVYATGPIYGEPGIHSLACGHAPKVLVSAKNVSKGYPAGADYFELEKYDDAVVSYLYIRDVDSPDLEKMRSAKDKGRWRRTLRVAR